MGRDVLICCKRYATGRHSVRGKNNETIIENVFIIVRISFYQLTVISKLQPARHHHYILEVTLVRLFLQCAQLLHFSRRVFSWALHVEYPKQNIHLPLGLPCGPCQ